MAAALQYLKEHQLFEYDDLAAKTDAATEQFHTLAGDIQQTEAELSRVSDLMAAVVQYAKTRPAFDGYKAAKYNRKYLAEHEAELANYRVPAIYIFRQACQFAFSFINLYLSALALLFNNNTSNFCH